MDGHITVGGLSEVTWRVGTVVGTINVADQIHQADRTMDQRRKAHKLEQISKMIRRSFMHSTCTTFLVSISVHGHWGI